MAKKLAKIAIQNNYIKTFKLLAVCVFCILVSPMPKI